MTIDVASVQLALVVAAVTMLILFYVITFRVTRSEYCGWWCVALLLFITGSAAYLLDGTQHQWWANPLGTAALVAGASSSWAGARALRTTRPAWWKLSIAPVLAAMAGALDSPSTNTWAGGQVYLLMMGLMLGLGSLDLWRLDRGLSRITRAVTAAAAIACVFYLFRCVMFVLVGPDSSVFETVAGTGIATLVNLVLLVTVSHSMTALSNAEATAQLRQRATVDDLTGLLNRSEFVTRATAELRRIRRAGDRGVVVMADVDHFKQINDLNGHRHGDHVLQQFAAACQSTVRPADLVGRIGGDEFVFLLSGAETALAAQITGEISQRMQMSVTPGRGAAPTVSYGIAAVDPRVSIHEAIAAADEAMFSVKCSGRDGHAVAGTAVRDIA